MHAFFEEVTVRCGMLAVVGSLAVSAAVVYLAGGMPACVCEHAHVVSAWQSAWQAAWQAWPTCTLLGL